MSAIQPPETQRVAVVAVGPLPPPVTGLSLITERIVERLKQHGRVTMLNVSPGRAANRLFFRTKRFFRSLSCLGRLIFRGRARDARLYVVANSKGGLLTTLALVAAGRMLGYPMYLHHHTYFYIDEHDWRMKWIVRMLGERGIHVVHSPQMADDFRARYPTRQTFEFVLPSIFALPSEAPRQLPGVPFCLGHMSNLSVDKGLDLVLELFRTLRRRDREVRLVLAGPFHTREAKRLVQQASQEFREHVTYLGAVHGSAKREFFSSIDCFLLPSKSESWGIVLNEAMAVGVPVIACRRGCTPTLVGEGAGIVVDDRSQYVQLAAGQIERWMDDAEAYRAASTAAVEQAACLEREGQAQLNAFAVHMFSPLAASTIDVRCGSQQPC